MSRALAQAAEADIPTSALHSEIRHLQGSRKCGNVAAPLDPAMPRFDLTTAEVAALIQDWAHRSSHTVPQRHPLAIGLVPQPGGDRTADQFAPLVERCPESVRPPTQAGPRHGRRPCCRWSLSCRTGGQLCRTHRPVAYHDRLAFRVLDLPGWTMALSASDHRTASRTRERLIEVTVQRDARGEGSSATPIRIP